MTRASTRVRGSRTRAFLARVYDRVEELYSQRRVWCRWCGDAPGREEVDGCCSAACLDQLRGTRPVDDEGP